MKLVTAVFSMSCYIHPNSPKCLPYHPFLEHVKSVLPVM